MTINSLKTSKKNDESEQLKIIDTVMTTNGLKTHYKIFFLKRIWKTQDHSYNKLTILWVSWARNHSCLTGHLLSEESSWIFFASTTLPDYIVLNKLDNHTEAEVCFCRWQTFVCQNLISERLHTVSGRPGGSEQPLSQGRKWQMR